MTTRITMGESTVVIPMEVFLQVEAKSPPLHKDVAAIIVSLTSRVSSPEYVRTPQFSRRGRRGNKDTEWVGSGSNSGPVPNFKVTKLQKREGLDGAIDQIRKYINKMSEKTYVVLRDKLFQEIDSHEGAGTSLEVATAIFDLVSKNAFYGALYARLYTELIAKYEAMKGILEERITSAGELLASVTYCDPKKDYDSFCENNRKNEEMRGCGIFYMHLANIGVIQPESVVNIVMMLQRTLVKAPMEESSCALRDELSERLFRMLTTPVVSCLKGDESSWNTIVTDLERYSKTSPAAKKGIPSKSVFRHMDTIDSLRQSRHIS